MVARKLIDTALSTGREELWDFTPRPLTHNTKYVRRGDTFPTVERRGYLPTRTKDLIMSYNVNLSGVSARAGHPLRRQQRD